MAKLKQENKGSYLDTFKKLSDQMKANSPVVETRWYVVDFYPSVSYNDERYGIEWTEPRYEIASQYLKTEEEAEKWMSLCDPEKGAELRIYHENRRVFTEERWVQW